jgi:hypothetical protein
VSVTVFDYSVSDGRSLSVLLTYHLRKQGRTEVVMNYTWKQFEEVTAYVRAGFNGICEKYRPLSPCLVFASPYGQLEYDAHPRSILADFPWMVADTEAKMQALRIAQQRNRLASGTPFCRKADALDAKLDEQLARLTYRGEVNFELRFGRLVYDLIWQLQQDPLIDRELTPLTRASIRIVVTTLDRAWQRMQTA